MRSLQTNYEVDRDCLWQGEVVRIYDFCAYHRGQGAEVFRVDQLNDEPLGEIFKVSIDALTPLRED